MEKQTIFFGIRPAIEAIKAGKTIDKLFIQNGLKNELIKELHQLMKEFQVPYQYVPVQKLNRITSKNHQGVVAFIIPITFYDIESIIPAIYERGEIPLILVLDRISDVRNFGAIARTAECAGVHAIVIPTKGAAQINGDAIKTSAGALHKIPVCRQPSLGRAAEYLKECGLQIVVCTEKTEEFLYKPNFLLPTAIILGSEEDGVSKNLMDNADRKVKIPMKGEIESLNVSVAAGVLLYEIMRQRLL